jgi:hypothetical protein
MRSHFAAVLIGAILIDVAFIHCAQDKAGNNPQLCSISGRVTDERRRPIQCWAYAIPVKRTNHNTILRDFYPPAGLDMKTVRTNEQGEYDLKDLPAREYIVKGGGIETPPSESPDCASCCGRRTEFLDEYYSGLPGAPKPKPLLLRAGQHLQGIDIRLVQVKLFCVHGEVRDTGNVLLARAGISLARKDPGFDWSSGVINQKGKFLLTIPAGIYGIKILEKVQSDRVLLERQFEVRNKNIVRLAIKVADRK